MLIWFIFNHTLIVYRANLASGAIRIKELVPKKVSVFLYAFYTIQGVKPENRIEYF